MRRTILFHVFAMAIGFGSMLMPSTTGVSINRFTWSHYGHDPQHSGIAAYSSQPTQVVKWTAFVDLQPQALIHYGSPLITLMNTVIFPVKKNTNLEYRIEARRGADGSVLWQQDTDYVLPPHDWIPSVSGVITYNNRLYYPGAGGTLMYCDNPDTANATATGRIAFFGMNNYQTDMQAYNSNVFINTPITADATGTIYFGVQVIGATPANLKSCIVKISKGGAVKTVDVQSASGDGGINKVAHNCAPALSTDSKYLYIAVSTASGPNAGGGYLLCLKTVDMTTAAKVRLKDPGTGNDAYLHDDGTSSPLVGPDGDVYYGVLENPFGYSHLRGFLLHFDKLLTTSKIPAAFGWDDTPSIVPKNMVVYYKGTSKYLLMMKYNNYVEGGGDGVNKIAVVDPNASQTDPISNVTVMKEFYTMPGPTPDSGHRDSAHPNAVREWCINTAAVDPYTRSILVNSEDGQMYRWFMDTNTLSPGLMLAPPTGEAYTPTVVGPDGAVYAINNSVLNCIGRAP